jgi:hypothetical protein
MKEIGTAYKISIGNPERYKLVGRHRFKWEDATETGLKYTKWECMCWIHLVQDRGRGCFLNS